MIFDGRYVADRLQTAAFLELQTSDDQLFGDLQEHLTPDVVEGVGVTLKFGSQEDVFRSVVSVLGIERLLQQEPSPVHVHTVLAGDQNTRRYLDRYGSTLRHLPIANGLKLLHAPYWRLRKDLSIVPYIQPSDDVVSSRIIVANTERREGEHAYPDLEQIGFAAALGTRYLPEVDDLEASLPYEIERQQRQDSDNSNEVIGPLARYLDYLGADLLLPHSSYSLSLGHLAAGFNVFGPGSNITEVAGGYEVTIQNGRAVHVEQLDDDHDEYYDDSEYYEPDED